MEWLGEVPEHWQVVRLGHVASYHTSSVDKKTKDGELPVRLCNYTDVYYQDRIRACDGEFMEATASPQEAIRFKLNVGDVLITKDSEDWQDIAIPALIDETAADFVCGYHLGIIRSGPMADSAFMFRAMQSVSVNRQLQTSASGVTRYGLPNAAVGDVILPIPPLDEQRAIAAFLDWETQRIDALVDKKRRLIERLQEYRTALITRTVTRGLPPEAARAAGLDLSPPLKPSGVEWLGAVPEHWEVKPLRSLVSFRGGATPNKAREEFWDGDIPWVSPKDMKRASIADSEDHVTTAAVAASPITMLPLGTVLVVVRGMILAHSFPVAVTTAPVTINQDMKALFSKHPLSHTYLYWYLVGTGPVIVSLCDESAHGTRKLESATLALLPIPVPRPDEQLAIVAFLDGEMERIDTLVWRVESNIERLQEHRTALITAAVTGKIDMRGSAPEPVAATAG